MIRNLLRLYRWLNATDPDYIGVLTNAEIDALGGERNGRAGA